MLTVGGAVTRTARGVVDARAEMAMKARPGCSCAVLDGGETEAHGLPAACPVSGKGEEEGRGTGFHSRPRHGPREPSESTARWALSATRKTR